MLDGVDGRVARLLKGTSRFGAELDSLADFVNFGVAPALVLYSFLLHQLRGIGWIVALVFAIAAALRLARFNVMLDDPNRPEWQKNFFVGMAAPAGATHRAAAALPPFPRRARRARPSRRVALVYVLAIAFLMVSTVPTFSGKTVGKYVPRRWVLPIFVVTVAFVGLLVSFTFEVLAVDDGGLSRRHPDRRHPLRAAPPGRGRAGAGARRSGGAAVRSGALRRSGPALGQRQALGVRLHAAAGRVRRLVR